MQRRDVLDLLEEPRVLQVLDRQQARKPRIGEKVPEGEADEAVHGLDRGVLAERQFALAAPDLLIGVEQHGAVERLLVAEVVVEQPLVGLGARGDGIDAGAVEALLAELVARRLQDRGLGALGVAWSRRRQRRTAWRRVVGWSISGNLAVVVHHCLLHGPCAIGCTADCALVDPDCRAPS